MGLVTPDCTRGVIDPLYHSRHNGRDRQYECDRGIKINNTCICRSVIRSFTWSGLETSTWSSSCLLTDQVRHDPDLVTPCQSLETTWTATRWWSDATAGAGYAMTSRRHLLRRSIRSSIFIQPNASIWRMSLLNGIQRRWCSFVSSAAFTNVWTYLLN